MSSWATWRPLGGSVLSWCLGTSLSAEVHNSKDETQNTIWCYCKATETDGAVEQWPLKLHMPYYCKKSSKLIEVVDSHAFIEQQVLLAAETAASATAPPAPAASTAAAPAPTLGQFRPRILVSIASYKYSERA